MVQPNKTTIVHVITSLSVGGAERMLYNIVSEMDKFQFTNIVISLTDFGYFGQELEKKGIAVFALNMRSAFSISALYKLWFLIRYYRPDYVQSWMYHANVVALIISKLAGVKKVYWNIRCSLMDLSQYRLGTKIAFKMGAHLSRFPSAIINNSKNSMQQHKEKGYINKKLLYLPNGFDTQKFRPNKNLYKKFREDHNLAADTTIIAMIARFDPMKDHATFIKAAGLLAKKHANVHFLLAGRNVNAQNKEIHDLIVQHDLTKKVLLLDELANVHETLPAIDYLTQTSIFGEGFPNVVAEAMSCGVVCFVTDVGESCAIIGDTGVTIAKGDPNDLCDKWSAALIQSPQQKDKARSAARARIIEHFSLDKVVAAYSNCYASSN